MMSDDPDKINDADRQIAQTIFTEGEKYAARNARSKAENKGRAESREKIAGHGIDTNAYHTAVRLVKDKSDRERKQWLGDLQLCLKVLGSRQAELFPDEALKIAKREEDRKREVAEAKAAAGRDPDHPRSDPKSGGAGKAKATKKPASKKNGGDKVKAAADRAEQTAAKRQGEMAAGVIHEPGTNPDADEQAEGEAALAALAPETLGKAN